MSNRLAHETSPYLLQHAHNPVDWYPWGEEALARAKAEDKPILLSVGYSACHWCHVMEKESFEDPETAARMNRDFVAIKVDREERPDLDELYMHAVQAFTGGRGGWPMTVFLLPDGRPFLGGTYFPPKPGRGMPSFTQVMTRAIELYTRERDKLERVSAQVVASLQGLGALPEPDDALATDWLGPIVHAASDVFDARWAGFGAAPKFPSHGTLAVLFAAWRRTGSRHALAMATKTLDAMARGGMYDLLAGGFARYSVDERWAVPHFEKMLYDNAQLVPVYVASWAATKNEDHRAIARETLDFVLRELTHARGGFFSALDADSEGVEGRHYVFTPEELVTILGADDGARAAALFDVTREGTFEHGTSVLRFAVERPELSDEDRALYARVRPVLLTARETRVRPGLDDKIITAWNGLMITALARAARVLGDATYRAAAEKAAAFLLEEVTVDGRLMRTWKDGRARHLGCLDDHVCLAEGLVELWEATFDRRWLDAALRLADDTVRLFWDDADGGLFFTGHDAERLVARSKNLVGGATPSGNGTAAHLFVRLDALCGRADLGAKAERILRSYQTLLERAPRALGPEALA
ncbi:thioredoxin domain-containing protein, partial [Myxococcota bacterium]|nr:thioredoxin domain-containing protein [Myxococcota bacterium]